MFTTDYSQVNDGNVLLPEGEYEVIFRSVDEGVSKKGYPNINVAMVVRNDIEQQYKNKYVWDTLMQKKDKTQADLSVGGYSYKRIQQLSKGAGLPNGKSYANIAEWCEEFTNRCARVTVYHETYEEKTRAKVKWYNETKYPNCKHIWKSADDDEEFVTDETPAQTQAPRTAVINDDDVPF